MFHEIPAGVLSEMRRLEALEAAQRATPVPAREMIRALRPEAAKLIAILAMTSPVGGALVELGTGAGYSTLWLALAARACTPARRVVTIEADPVKAAMAKEALARTGLDALVEQRVGDAAAELASVGPIAFAFMDHSPTNYAASFPSLVERLPSGGLITADNVESHREQLQPFLDTVMSDRRLDATILSVGKGILLGRRC